MTDPQPKNPKRKDSALNEGTTSVPTYGVEWNDGEGIAAIYSDGLTEKHVRDFCERLIEYLKLPAN